MDSADPVPFVARSPGLSSRASLARRLRARLARTSLATRFAVAGGLVLSTVTLAIGGAMTDRIEASVVRQSAAATALYMEAFVSPIGQSLAVGTDLSPGAARALEELFAVEPLASRVASYKLWGPDGLVLRSSDPGLAGQRFPITEGLARAWQGEVRAEFEDLEEDESAAESALGVPLLEIYSPIREDWSGRVVGVIEFYEVATDLAADLHAARLTAWTWTAGLGFGLGALLYLIVLGGSRTIETQRRALDARLAELHEMSLRNTDLRLRVQTAAARAAAETERAMRRIGADLHDGPAQQLAFAALRLDSLADQMPPAARPDLMAVSGAVAEAMAEIRAASRGLALPEIAGKSLTEIVTAAAEAHALRTGTEVILELSPDALPVPEAVRICAFRFVQEGLNNATRHAGGTGVVVRLTQDGRRLRLAVLDRGPGPGAPSGLGLSGLRDRVESLGGRFDRRSRDGGGSELVMTFDPGDTPWT